MISWEDAQELTPHEFGQKIILEIESASNKKCTYASLATMIYRSKSRMMTWLSPNSAEHGGVLISIGGWRGELA